jgi:hypothetical protein
LKTKETREAQMQYWADRINAAWERHLRARTELKILRARQKKARPHKKD